MKITIINGTNRIGNRTLEISQTVVVLAKRLGYEVELVDLDNFTELFRGEHVTFANSTPTQKQDIRHLISADILLFIVPTYHSGIPSALKNFLDALKCYECFDSKVISFVSSNSHNHDYGARQARDIVNGILSYQKSHSFIMPRITTVDYTDIDTVQLTEHMQQGISFVQHFNSSNN